MNNLELDNVKLIQKKVDEENGVVRLIGSINKLQISDKRNIIEHKTTGMQGGALIDQGRSSTIVTFEGVFLGEDAKTSAEELRAKFKAGAPIQILSDISCIAEINQVLIEDLKFIEGQGYQQQYRYSIRLREYVEPPKEDDPPPDQEAEAEEEAEEEADNSEKSYNYITGKVVDDDEKPLSNVIVKLLFNNGEEYQIKTDAEGIYYMENIPVGKYEIVYELDDYLFVNKKAELI